MGSPMDEFDIDLTPAQRHKAEQQQKLIAQQHQQLLDAYAWLAQQPQGVKIVQDLNERFIMNNPVNHDATNINYVAAYKNGEAGAVQYINHMITRGASND